MQQVFAVRRKFDQHLAMVIIAVSALQGAALDKSINKLHRTVMAKAKLPGNRGNCGTDASGQTFDGQEQLMLLRFDTLRSGYLLAKMQELSDTMSKLSKLAQTSG